MKFQRSSFYPDDAQRVAVDGVMAEAFISTRAGVPYACGFAGKAQKPAFNYRFKSDQQRSDYIDKFFAGVKSSQDAKAAAQALKKDFVTTLKPGDILYSSWGYDQTNIDFYQVIDVKPSGKSVVIRSIASSYTALGDMQGNKSAIKDKFIGEPMLKRVALGNRVRIESFASAIPWDGKPKGCSSYA